MHTIDIDGQQIEVRATHQDGIATTPYAFVGGRYAGRFLGCSVIARPFLMMHGQAYELTEEQKAVVMDVYTREILPQLNQSARTMLPALERRAEQIKLLRHYELRRAPCPTQRPLHSKNTSGGQKPFEDT